MSKSRTLLISAFCLTLAGHANALIYDGLSIGAGQLKAEGTDSGNIFDDKDTTTAYTLLAGYDVNPLMAVQAEYTDFGSYSFSINGNNSNEDASNKNYGVFGIIRLPLLLFRPYAKAGIGYYDFKPNNDTSNSPFKKDSGTSYSLGVGVDFTLLPFIDVGVEAQQYDMGDNSQSFIGLTLKAGI